LRVLDLDLDFFLTGVCYPARKGERPVEKGVIPWTDKAVRVFLENNLGLSREFPKPGQVFETHDGALEFWKGKMDSGALEAPFSVVHIDAHSDLGIGTPGPYFVLDRVLARRPPLRADLPRYYSMQKLDEANYLLFALAFRWISALVNVRNPFSQPDIPEEIVNRGPGGEYASIKMRCPLAKILPQYDYGEPEIPFRVVNDYRAFRDRGDFDFVTLAISPRYAPKEADGLIGVVREYISEEIF